MKVLITGGCGFLGSNLASYGFKKGYDIHLFDNLSRFGSEHNLKWLKENTKIQFCQGDIRNYFEINELIKKIKPDAIFHLAGQVAMTKSIENPIKDMEINIKGTLNVLESARQYLSNPIIIYSSTNKVYGDLEQYNYTETPSRYNCESFSEGISELTDLDFRSPYGCSKGAADQYTLDYYRLFNLSTVVFRHSSMYGGRQYSTFDQGWVGWFCSLAKKEKRENLKKPILISGTGKQVRDLLHAEDMCELYYKTIQNIEVCRGNVYNIGGGAKNSLSLLELFQFLEKKLDLKLNIVKQDFRQSDQKFFVANISKINSHINWLPKVNYIDGLNRFLEWIE